MCKLLVLDIDGTLVPDGAATVPAENVAAIAAARRAGLRVALATARKFRPAYQIARQLELDTPIICHGGAYIAYPDGTILHHTPLELEIAHEMADFADSAGHRLIITVDECNYLAHHYLPDVDAPFEDLVVLNTNREGLVGRPTRIATVDECGSIALYEHFHRDRRAVFSRFYRQDTLYCVAVFHPQANKGNALRLLCDHLDIAPSETLAMGDMETDISMFHAAGNSIAMPHSPPEVKQAAALTAPSNGPAVAWAIRRLLAGSLTAA